MVCGHVEAKIGFLEFGNKLLYVIPTQMKLGMFTIFKDFKKLYIFKRPRHNCPTRYMLICVCELSVE